MIETMKTSFPYILLLLLTVFSASPSSGQYTPVDISNLPAENRSDLAKVARRVKMWPTVLQDALITAIVTAVVLVLLTAVEDALMIALMGVRVAA